MKLHQPLSGEYPSTVFNANRLSRLIIHLYITYQLNPNQEIKDDPEPVVREDILIEAEEEDGAYEHFRITVDKGQTPLRIDKFLFNRIEAISRSKIQQAAAEGMILVNGIAVKSNYKVKPLDLVTIMLSEPKMEHDLLPENIPLNIVFEDSDVVIINKPPGLVVHPGWKLSGKLPW